MENFNLDDFFGETTFMKAVELYEAANKDLFVVGDLTFSYKEISDWSGHGLLIDRRADDTKWRKFNFVDYVWLNLINDLRGMGVAYSIIRKLKENLNETIPFTLLMDLLEANLPQVEKTVDKDTVEKLKIFLQSKEREGLNNKEGVSIIYLLIVECLVTRSPISIIIFKDGSWLPSNENRKQHTKEEIERMTFETHVTISVATLIRKFLCSDESVFVLGQLKILEENETRLLEMINSGEYESITINFKSKKMKSFHLVKEQDVKKKVVDVIAEGSYQDVIIKSHNGIITKIQNTVKVRLN